MDSPQAQAAAGGRRRLLVKRGCLSEERIAVVLATQDAMRASSLALEVSVVVTPMADDIQDTVRFTVTLTRSETDERLKMVEPPVRTRQTVIA